MNTNFLFQHIADQLQTRIIILNQAGEVKNKFQCQAKIFDLFSSSPESIHFFLENVANQSPLLSSVNQDFMYASVAMDQFVILLGPVRLYSYLSVIHTLHKTTEVSYDELHVNKCEFTSFVQHAVLLHNLFNATSVSNDDLIYANCNISNLEDVEKRYSNLLFTNREMTAQHNPYSQELRMLSAVESGDLELLKNSFIDDDPANLGKLAKNEDRSYRNICISVITLISRAAIRGGINPELAFSLCDSYIMAIEELRIADELKPLVEGAKMRFTVMVHDLKKTKQKTNPHPLVEKSKNYILTHLHDKITLQDIAKRIDASPNYLSELFRKHELVSFSDYVLREKINMAKNMLIYSENSYTEIASLLGFSSQSHLGKQFKAITGMTLKQYRDSYSAMEYRLKQLEG